MIFRDGGIGIGIELKNEYFLDGIEIELNIACPEPGIELESESSFAGIAHHWSIHTLTAKPFEL